MRPASGWRRRSCSASLQRNECGSASHAASERVLPVAVALPNDLSSAAPVVRVAQVTRLGGVCCALLVASALSGQAKMGVDRFLVDILPPAHKADAAWDYYRFAASAPPADTDPVCLDGSPYSVQIRGGSADKVLLYLEGGGACWNQQTCWQAELARKTARNPGGQGILNFADATNPFRSWTVVHAPYCDGSVFSGHRTVSYGGEPTYHHGLQNVSSAISVMRFRVRNPTQIVIAGSSAGAYGGLSAYRIVRAVYPGVSILVILASGVGLHNPDDRIAVAERAEHWGFRQLLPPDCDRCNEQFTYAWQSALARDGNLRVAVIDYERDGILGFFLKMEPQALKALWDKVTGDVQRSQPDRFKRLILHGRGHVVMTSPSFYSNRAPDGSIARWINAAVERSPEWRDLVAPSMEANQSGQR